MLYCVHNDNDHDDDDHYDNDNDDNNDDDDNALWQGTRVEGDRKGKGTWYPGVISCDRSVNQSVSQSVSKFTYVSISLCLSLFTCFSLSLSRLLYFKS